MSFILASGSPRRRQLLEMLDLPFRVVPPNVDELAADTTVVLRGAVFEKPHTPAEAAAMLAQLAGRTHQVMTAVAVARDGRLEHALDVTEVTFRPLSADQIAAYVATGEPMDKAGAYAIQGKGAALVEGIRGDFFGVMGLPLRLALDLLERFGLPYRFTR